MRKRKHMYGTSTSSLLVGVLVGILFVVSCRNNSYPKPYGYFRVDLPEHTYISVDTLLPYSFDRSTHAHIAFKSEPQEQYWIDIIYPSLNATIHCSYKEVKGKLYDLTEDAHRSVYKHLVRADDIQEKFFDNPEQQVYGVFYDLQGDVASVAQFTLTDSVQHFFRGAVYFNHVPNKDSIAPMADYIKKDVVRLMESFSWK
jgi:gliding motility-associated lipoprotein GldD